MVLKGGKALGPALLSEDRRTRSRGSRKRRGVFIRRACVDIRRGVCVSEDVKTRWRVVRRNPEGRCSGVSRRNGPVWTHLRISGPLVLCITLTSKTTPASPLRGRTQSTDEQFELHPSPPGPERGERAVRCARRHTALNTRRQTAQNTPRQTAQNTRRQTAQNTPRQTAQNTARVAGPAASPIAPALP